MASAEDPDGALVQGRSGRHSMKRETFVSILSALLAEADDELLREAEGLCFWRRRELRAQAVLAFSPGQQITYTNRAGKTAEGTIDHLNKYSVSLKRAHPTEGYTVEVIPVERILGATTEPLDLPETFGQHLTSKGHS